MTSRAFGMVFAVVVGTPLFAVGVIVCVPAACAIGFCLGVSAAGIVGAAAAIVLLEPLVIRHGKLAVREEESRS